MDIAGNSFLVGNPHLVVYRGVGILGYQAVAWYVADGRASACGNQKDPPKENKNPYSVKGRDGNRL